MRYSEIDADGHETRKVDKYRDGHLDVAGRGMQTGSTNLAEAPVPPLDEINADPQFEGVAITAEECDEAWRSASLDLGD